MSEFVVVQVAGATSNQQDGIVSAITGAGGEIVLGLASTAAIVSGDQSVIDAVQNLVGNGVDSVITDPTALPAGLDSDISDLVHGWARTHEADWVQAIGDGPTGVSWGLLGGCGLADA